MKRIKADDYLTLAEQIAGRPRPANLRRATSTAYYAVFHELVGQGARRAVASGTADHRHTVSRWYAHGNFRQTARWVTAIAADKSAPEAVTRLLSVDGRVDPDLVLVADSFGELQALRHVADYDPGYVAARTATLSHVRRARTAVEAIRRLDKGAVHEFDMFLLLSLGGERMVRNA
ncbi:hypothetical protein [Herbidospora cretacea]|uniref:hypothetical protein n=1 Tax=Herbidospora cretacea TaxID=28444 RepID=UPI0004C2B680|nr:hypothetical protein [Herbidospora cretacea]